MSQKPVFEGHFQFFWRNRKYIPKTKGRGPYSALNSNYWRLNFENRSSSFRAMREQPTDIHTDIQTYRQTYIHTYRQTNGTKVLYRYTYIKRSWSSNQPWPKRLSVDSMIRGVFP